jgi:hypothetical protein
MIRASWDALEQAFQRMIKGGYQRYWNKQLPPVAGGSIVDGAQRWSVGHAENRSVKLFDNGSGTGHPADQPQPILSITGRSKWN